MTVVQYFHIFAFSFILLPLLSSAQGKVEQASDGGSGTIKFGPPDLNSEVESSFFIPDKLKCDACRAISYQVLTNLHCVTLRSAVRAQALACHRGSAVIDADLLSSTDYQ